MSSTLILHLSNFVSYEREEVGRMLFPLKKPLRFLILNLYTKSTAANVLPCVAHKCINLSLGKKQSNKGKRTNFIAYIATVSNIQDAV